MRYIVRLGPMCYLCDSAYPEPTLRRKKARTFDDYDQASEVACALRHWWPRSTCMVVDADESAPAQSPFVDDAEPDRGGKDGAA